MTLEIKKNFQVPLYRGYKIIENAKKLLNGHSKNQERFTRVSSCFIRERSAPL